MGAPRAIESPEELYRLFSEYKEWVKTNPYKMHDFKGKDADEVWIQKQRPISWSGFEGHLARLDILVHLGHYEQNSNDSYAQFLPIIARIKKECSADIIDGALAGAYNQNIAARIEGLADKKEVDRKTTKVKFTDAG